MRIFVLGIILCHLPFGCLLSADATKAFRTARDEIRMAEKRPQLPIRRASAALNPVKKSNAQGVVTFQVVEGGVRVVAKVEGLSPGKHGIHIHEFGDCSASDGASIGGHFNPTCSCHGGPYHATRHAGDLGNIVANEFGYASFDHVDPMLHLEGPCSIIGRSIAINVGSDDYVSQPNGNSGGIACFGMIVER
jgi:Cu-Zn family superoxide dismutase